MISLVSLENPCNIICLRVLYRINGKHWFIRQVFLLSREGESRCRKSFWTECWLPTLTGHSIKLNNKARISLEHWNSRPRQIELECLVCKEKGKIVDVTGRKERRKKKCTKIILEIDVIFSTLTHTIHGWLSSGERSAIVNDSM